MDFSDIISQEHAKRAIEVSLAGNHPTVLIGGHGVGKSMLIEAARRVDSGKPAITEALPCPCGNLGNPSIECLCTPKAIEKHTNKLKEMNRDTHIFIELPPIRSQDILRGVKGEPTKEIRRRVKRAWQIQQKRFGKKFFNSMIQPGEIGKYCVLDKEAEALLKMGIERLGLDLRKTHNVMRLARTIADLDAAKEHINAVHISEAIQYSKLLF